MNEDSRRKPERGPSSRLRFESEEQAGTSGQLGPKLPGCPQTASGGMGRAPACGGCPHSFCASLAMSSGLVVSKSYISPRGKRSINGIVVLP